jgi:hypothetical protein
MVYACANDRMSVVFDFDNEAFPVPLAGGGGYVRGMNWTNSNDDFKYLGETVNLAVGVRLRLREDVPKDKLPKGSVGTCGGLVPHTGNVSVRFDDYGTYAVLVSLLENVPPPAEAPKDAFQLPPVELA